MQTVLSNLLEEIENTFGTEKCLDYCNSIYSSMYRSELTFTFNDVTDSAMKNAMISHVISYLCTKAGISDEYDIPEQFRANAIELVLNGIEFVDICNYKGEGEGFALLEEMKTNRIYVSKYNYK